MPLKVGSVHIPRLKKTKLFTKSKYHQQKHFLRMVKKGGH